MMLSRYEWYRRCRGGYWIYLDSFGWRKTGAYTYFYTKNELNGKLSWSLEDYT